MVNLRVPQRKLNDASTFPVPPNPLFGNDGLTILATLRTHSWRRVTKQFQSADLSPLLICSGFLSSTAAPLSRRHTRLGSAGYDLWAQTVLLFLPRSLCV